MLEIFERLAAAGIDLLPAESSTHFLFVRDGFVSLVERREKGFGNIGAPGLMRDEGFAVLVWRAGEPFFVSKGCEQRASPTEIAALRAFDQDLRAALQT